jgi:hypothetical protein
MRKAESYFRLFPDDVAIPNKVGIIGDSSLNSGRCALCHCSPNTHWCGVLLFWNELDALQTSETPLAVSWLLWPGFVLIQNENTV